MNYIDKVKPFGNYTARIEFDENNYSLLLKNVQQRDSGIYTAKITDNDGNRRDVATHRLTVQEAPPIPKVRVELLSSAGGFCKVSVNCSAKDIWANYTCDHAHCTQVENTTSPSGDNIIVTATNGIIHCSSSNQVETKTNSTKNICQPKVNTGDNSAVYLPIIITCIFIIIIIAIFFILRRRKGHSENPKSKLGTPTPTAFEKTQTKANPTDPKSEVGTPTSVASEKTAQPPICVTDGSAQPTVCVNRDDSSTHPPSPLSEDSEGSSVFGSFNLSPPPSPLAFTLRMNQLVSAGIRLTPSCQSQILPPPPPPPHEEDSPFYSSTIHS
ncbi:hypothetical protein SKAU_G00077600 [Synaphobranchus kaupii]|uniref:Uncharacterized protein n=1 Tax=Synaphobranchus kaupii TaxID=118154 RepID=A0A9Q1G9K8_SYNKA|nr:hypothetical protein SKAU_G00077600 [Synaphobranchus kaupii]